MLEKVLDSVLDTPRVLLDNMLRVLQKVSEKRPIGIFSDRAGLYPDQNQRCAGIDLDNEYDHDNTMFPHRCCRSYSSVIFQRRLQYGTESAEGTLSDGGRNRTPYHLTMVSIRPVEIPDKLNDLRNLRCTVDWLRSNVRRAVIMLWICGN